MISVILCYSVCYRVDETEGPFTRFVIHCKNHQLRNVTNYLVDCSDVLKYNIIRDEVYNLTNNFVVYT